jgi:hypothetical protein
MLVAFEELPESARVWIYQSDKILESGEVDYISEQAMVFCKQWSAHNIPLRSAYKIIHNKFLVLAVDEQFNQASGCSIDSSINFIKTLESKLRINFFDRTEVAFLIDDTIYTTNLHSIKNKIIDGEIGPKTFTFNLQAQNIAEFQNNWLIPTENSWMKRYF